MDALDNENDPVKYPVFDQPRRPILDREPEVFLGARLARLEAGVTVEERFKRFSEWEVACDNAVQAQTSTVRGWETLPVRDR